jgi:Fe-S-cluster containining protein
MEIDKLYKPQYLSQLANKAHRYSQKHLRKIKAKKPRKLDELFETLHYKAFDTIDCLKCANCCYNLGPRLTNKDIERLAKTLRLKSHIFIEQYLKIDEDKDYVFKQMPCPFLAPDNYCMIYEQRPKACREYPHTANKKMIKLLNLTLKNAETCPAVYLVLEDLKMIPPAEIK